MTTIRFFAAARAAVGVDSLTTTGPTIDAHGWIAARTWSTV
jgi:molybdopterin synthase sulfur carrier subunit